MPCITAGAAYLRYCRSSGAAGLPVLQVGCRSAGCYLSGQFLMGAAGVTREVFAATLTCSARLQPATPLRSADALYLKGENSI